MNNINILSWNVRGVMSSAFPLSNLLDKYDIDVAIISEHKLFPHSRHFLASINPKYAFYSVESKSLNPYSRAQCGKGGIAILVNKSIKSNITQIDTCTSDRIIGVEVTGYEMPVYIFGVYLPSDNNNSVYTETISELEALIAHYCSLGHVITAGDYNAQISDYSQNFKSKTLTQLVKTYDLFPVNLKLNSNQPKYSYTNNKTMIDHILVTQNIVRDITKFDIIEESNITTSDHLPLLMSVNIQTLPSSNTRNKNMPKHTLNWYKAKINQISILQYQNALDTAFRLSDLTAIDDVNDLNNTIVKCLKYSAIKHIPS